MSNIIKCDLNNYDKSVVDDARRILMSCGTVIMPTDSVYGIGCAAFAHNEAKANIFKIKKRPATQTLPWLISDIDDIDKWADGVPEWALELARRWWPGALTLVVKASENVDSEFTLDDGSIALRVPNCNLVRDIIREVGCPLATTSANTHGCPAANTSSDLEDEIVSKADLTIMSGDTICHDASTIVKCIDDSPSIIREGAISASDIWEVIDECR